MRPVCWNGRAERMLFGLDFDAENLPHAQERLTAVGNPFHLAHANFAGLSTVLGQLGHGQVNAILADLGMSSMQVDDPERGFSYRRDGILDMRTDRSKGRTAAQILKTITEDDLTAALRDFGDEPDARLIAANIVKERDRLERTNDLVEIIQRATGQSDWQLHPQPGQWNLHPAARTFQALRILVNRELANLENLLRIAPSHLQPGGTLAIISFHSGEDRVVKSALRAGKAEGVYGEIAQEPLRASPMERQENPRARSATCAVVLSKRAATVRQRSLMVAARKSGPIVGGVGFGGRTGMPLS